MLVRRVRTDPRPGESRVGALARLGRVCFTAPLRSRQTTENRGERRSRLLLALLRFAVARAAELARRLDFGSATVATRDQGLEPHAHDRPAIGNSSRSGCERLRGRHGAWGLVGLGVGDCAVAAASTLAASNSNRGRGPSTGNTPSRWRWLLTQSGERPNRFATWATVSGCDFLAATGSSRSSSTTRQAMRSMSCSVTGLAHRIWRARRFLWRSAARRSCRRFRIRVRQAAPDFLLEPGAGLGHLFGTRLVVFDRLPHRRVFVGVDGRLGVSYPLQTRC